MCAAGLPAPEATLGLQAQGSDPEALPSSLRAYTFPSCQLDCSGRVLILLFGSELAAFLRQV